MSATDDLLPIPPQPEISEGNEAFHQKAYALYKWIREKLAPAIIEVTNLIINAVTGAFTSVSSDSVTMASSGDLSFAIGLNKSFVPGTPTRLAYITDPTNYVDGVCKSYDKTTGAFVLTASGMNGSGMYNNWSVSIIPSAGGGLASLLTNKFTGLQSLANEVTIASATTLDLTAAGSNQFKLTGTVPVEGVTMPQGAVIKGMAAGATPLINSAAFKVQGGANYTCTPGDWLEFKKDADGNVHVSITPVSGKAITAPKNGTNDSTFSSTSADDPASPEWVIGYSPIKAWVNFNGTGTVAIRASKNVSSVTDNGVGDYTINFTSALADANYSCLLTTNASGSSSDYRPIIHPSISPTTIAVRVLNQNSAGAGGTQDTSIFNAAILR